MTALHVEATTRRLLVGTADGRLISLDPEADRPIASEIQIADAAVLSLGAREDGAVLVILEGSPRMVRILEGAAGVVTAALTIDDLEGAALRPDNTLATWDARRRLEMVDPASEPLVTRSIDLSDLEQTDRGDWVGIDEGQAVITYDQHPTKIVIDLATGARHTPSLRLPDGPTFNSMGPPMLFEGGHSAISASGEVALWRDGELIDLHVLAEDPSVTTDGFANIGSRLVVGVDLGNGKRRLHLLELGGRIDRRAPRHRGPRRDLVRWPDRGGRNRDDAGWRVALV